MLKRRLLAAGAILVPVLLLCWLDDQRNFDRPGIWLVPLAVAFGLLAAAEVVGMLRRGGYAPRGWAVYCGSLLLLLAASAPLLGPAFPLGGPWERLGLTCVAVMAAVGIVLVGEMQRYREPGSSTVNAALAIFVVMYVALPITFLVHLRLLHANRWGLLAVLSVLFVVKLSDSGAYFVGRSFGKRKLSPRLSPNKTIEGAVGALVVGCAASWFFFYFLAHSQSDVPMSSGRGWAWIAYGATLTVAGMLGDLAESLIKRDMQQKDSSRWLPGLGGVLDIMDSLLLAAPVAYLWWATGGVGPCS